MPKVSVHKPPHSSKRPGGPASERSREAAPSRHPASLGHEAQGQASIADPHDIGRADIKSASAIPGSREPGKRRGGQPGNVNARTTGIYSQVVTVRDDVDASSMPRDMSDQELALARVRLKHLILEQRQAPPQQWLSFEKAIQHYIDRIANITYKNAMLGRQQGAAFTTVMEMIRQANEEQGVT